MKTYLTEEFIDEQNEKLSLMGLQLNSLLSHPQCSKDKCYCGQTICYYSPLWSDK